MKKYLAFSLSDVVFIKLINVKMPTFVGILTFMSRINIVLNWVEHKKFYNLGASKIILNMHAQLSSLARSLNFWLSLFRLSCLVDVSSKGSDETAG